MLTLLLIAPWMLSGLLANYLVIRLFLEDVGPLETENLVESMILSAVLGPMTVVMAVVFILVNRGK